MNTQTLRAYHNDPAIKAKYLDRVRAHAAADRLIQGTGWDGHKGCAVGCTLETYNHMRYPIELGLPEWLARLEDAIFEGSPKADAMQWPQAFLEAIPVGADLTLVHPKLALRRMDRLITMQQRSLGKHGEAIDAVITQTIDAIQQVRRCLQAEIGGNVCDVSEMSRSAESAARAARAARAAADSADSADSAAGSAAWKQEAADLLDLLREAK